MSQALGIISALFTRMLFISHGAVSIWMVLQFHPNKRWYWTIATGIMLLVIEMFYTLIFRRGAEYKYFWPSCLFYLGTLVPVVWILELDLFEDRVQNRQSGQLTVSGKSGVFTLSKENGAKNVCEVGLVIIVIAGRWMLPRGSITRNQLSALLLEYVGIAADILELFQALEGDIIGYNITVATLCVYTWSLLQFTLVTTATENEEDKEEAKDEMEEIENALKYSTIRRKYLRKMVKKADEEERRKAKRKQAVTSSRINLNLSDNGMDIGSSVSIALSQYELKLSRRKEMKKRQLHGDLFGILATILMQDGPFFALRLILITAYSVTSEMQIFFAGKNAVSIALLLYRLYVLQCKNEEDKKTPYEKFRKVSMAVLASTHFSNGKSKLIYNGN